MNRPDTGTRNNMIMEMAAAILDNKADYYDCIAEQLEEKGDSRATKWRELEAKARQARDTIDENAGCWI